MKKNKDFFKELNIIDGVITYNDLLIDECIPFQEQRDAYKEDLLQITYQNNFLIDVGWYPAMNPKGQFVISALQDYDWQNPLLTLQCRTLSDLKKNIENAVKIIKNKQQAQ